MSAEYAVALVENASPEALERAEAVIAAVLDCQDMDRRSPHFGNFKWEHEDGAVEDLNAVQFVLVRLIPLLLNHSDRLSRAARSTQDAEAHRPRAGRDPPDRRLARLLKHRGARHLQFTIGRPALNLPEYIERGAAKLRDNGWRSSDQSGIPHEYNSPTYSFVLIEALHKVVAFSRTGGSQAAG